MMNWIYNIKGWILMIGVIFAINIQAQNPNWTAPNSSDYTSSANAITTIYLNGTLSNNAGDRIAIFSGNELRGLSEPVDFGSQDYQHFITIYSNLPTEVMSIKIYHQATDLLYDVAAPITFETQKIYGSVDAPMALNIYDDNDAPIFINTLPFQITLEGIPFEEIDLMEYLVQVDDQDVTWSFTPNSNLIVNLNGSILQVEGAPGFSGYTPLTVRATELPMTTLLRGARSGQNWSRAQSAAQFAETNVGFYVTPEYEGPAWYNIPSQGIVIGDQFTPVNLHDYEYQYGGPAIQYDYAPIIIENDPPEAKPSWTFSGNYQTNMTVIVRADYTPKYQFEHEDDILAAYINDEIRGVATLNPASGLYFITIAGSAIEMQGVTFKFYSGLMKKLFELEDEFNYESHQIKGGIDNPYLLEFAPIVPVIVDYPISGGQLVMPVNIVDTTYLGTEFFEFYAFDPTYPTYLNDTTETSFCIVSDSSELTILYVDMDGDGLGDPNNYIVSCSESPGYVTNGDDCDDTNPVDPTITITIMENSAGTANDGFVCVNDNVTLTASGGTAYEWSTGEITATINVIPNYASVYKVTATTGMTCKGVAIADIEIEGKVVTNSTNDGHGSLRSVILCLIDGDTITYDQPTTTFSDITAPILIDKDVNILEESILMRPEIRLDYTGMTKGFEVLIYKNLNIENIDFKIINWSVEPLLTGPGSMNIHGRTEVKE